MTARLHRPTAHLRWPLEPLLLRSKLTVGDLRRLTGFGNHAVTLAEREGLSDLSSDRWAIRLGLHPSQVWGPSWDEAGLSVLDDQHVNGGGWRQAWEWAETAPVVELEVAA